MSAMLIADNNNNGLYIIKQNGSSYSNLGVECEFATTKQFLLELF